MCGNAAPSFSTAGGVAVSVLKAIAYFAFFLACQFAVTVVFMMVCILLNIGAGIDSALEYATNLTFKHTALISIVTGVLTAVALFLFVIVRKKSFGRTVGINGRIHFKSLIFEALGISANFFVSLLMSFIPISKELIEKYEELYSFIGQGNIVIEILSVVVVAPIVEELVFRGFMYRTLRKTTPVWFSAIVVSVLFGIAHGNEISFVYTVFLGLLLVAVNEKSNSLLASVCVHMGFNLGSYFVSFIPEMDFVGYAVILLISCVVTIGFAILSLSDFGEGHKEFPQSAETNSNITL